MSKAKLEDLYKNIIMFHYGVEFWAIYPERNYEETIKYFLDDLVKATVLYKKGKYMKPYRFDVNQCFEPNTDEELMGGKIQDLRLKKGLSIKQMARRTGLDAAYYENLERGVPITRLWSIERILHVLRIPSSAIMPF